MERRTEATISGPLSETPTKPEGAVCGLLEQAGEVAGAGSTELVLFGFGQDDAAQDGDPPPAVDDLVQDTGVVAGRDFAGCLLELAFEGGDVCQDELDRHGEIPAR